MREAAKRERDEWIVSRARELFWAKYPQLAAARREYLGGKVQCPACGNWNDWKPIGVHGFISVLEPVVCESCGQNSALLYDPVARSVAIAKAQRNSRTTIDPLTGEIQTRVWFGGREGWQQWGSAMDDERIVARRERDAAHPDEDRHLRHLARKGQTMLREARS